LIYVLGPISGFIIASIALHVTNQHWWTKPHLLSPRCRVQSAGNSNTATANWQNATEIID